MDERSSGLSEAGALELSNVPKATNASSMVAEDAIIEEDTRSHRIVQQQRSQTLSLPSLGTAAMVKDEGPRISCCYGLMVFLGLTASLLALTFLVIYAGFWSQQSLYHDHLILVIGGSTQEKEPINDIGVLSLPESSRTPYCSELIRLPMAISGAVGAVLMKHVSFCGGQIRAPNTTKNSVSADCFKYTWQGWKKFRRMTKPRAFAASAWVPRRGWWVTGGINEQEPDGISTSDVFNEEDTYGPEHPDDAFLLGPILPEAVAYHCLVQIPGGTQFVLIGGSTAENKYSAKVWIYDWVQREWTSTSPLLRGRHSPACSLAHAGESIVVAGGATELNMDGSKSVEMFDISMSMWHKMPSLPHSVTGGRSAKLNPGMPHGHGGFAVVGGSYNQTAIMQFVRRGQFEVGNEATSRSLSVPRRYALVMVVSPRLVCL